MRETMLAVTANQMGVIDCAAFQRQKGPALLRLAGVAVAAIVTRYQAVGPMDFPEW